MYNILLKDQNQYFYVKPYIVLYQTSQFVNIEIEIFYL